MARVFLDSRVMGLRNLALLGAASLVLVACGSDRNARNYGSTASQNRVTSAAVYHSTARFASGPIANACLQAGRKAANRQLCGCVQHVADRSLSSADQRRAVGFFADPHSAQEIRQSDGSRNEAFWQRYKAFAARAEQTCQGL
ncbi:MAG: arginine transporter [Pelagimonas sp.]|jgi:hypothetical protein|nr:arginine transporter [Pelagimonas sp.]